LFKKGKEKQKQSLKQGTESPVSVTVTETRDSHGDSYETIAVEYDVSDKNLKKWTTIKRFMRKNIKKQKLVGIEEAKISKRDCLVLIYKKVSPKIPLRKQVCIKER
jgi:LysM repeat protein